MKNIIYLFALVLSLTITTIAAASCLQKCDQAAESCYRQCREDDPNCYEKCEMTRMSCNNKCEEQGQSCRLSCISKYEGCLDSKDWHGEDDLIRCERLYEVCSMKCDPELL